MLEKLFGNPVIEKVLFVLIINEKCYGAQLSKQLNVPLFSIQKALMRLEDGGVIVAENEGRTRVYQFNPRYPFLSELKSFIKKAYDFLPESHKEMYDPSDIRKRPRKTGKRLKRVSDD